MGWKHVNTLKRETSSPSKERVGNMDGSNDVRNEIRMPLEIPNRHMHRLWPQTYLQEAMPTTEERWRNKTE